jgi:hypothetical protein
MKTQGCILPCYGKYVYIGGVWYHKGHQCHKGSPYSLVNKPQRRVHATLSDALEGGMRPFTQSIGASSTTKVEAPNKPTKLSHTKNELRGDFFWLGFQGTKSNKQLTKQMGN